MKRNLIGLGSISAILIAFILIRTPFEEITYKDFGGVYGVAGFFVLKIIVEEYLKSKR